MYSYFADVIKRKGLTPYRVAKDTGISQATLSDWKNGRCIPKAGKLLKIAKYLDVPVEKLIEEEC